MKATFPSWLGWLCFLALIALACYERYPQRIWQFLLAKNENKQKRSYLDNDRYLVDTEQYKYYDSKGNIVMLGNSITNRTEWNELLGRQDIINRGIDGDFTSGMLNRLDHVIAIQPQLCFVLGGINDLLWEIETDTVAANLSLIVRKLQENSINPIVQSTIYIARSFPDHQAINQRVTTLNKELRQMCQELNVPFLDINAKLAPEHYLEARFAADHVHLNAEGYQEWKTLILPAINTALDSLNNPQ